MVVVLDTNVWISGMLWGGPPREIIFLAERNEIDIASSAALLEELFGVLSREKFRPHLAAAGIDAIALQTLTRKEINAALKKHLDPAALVISGAGPVAPHCDRIKT